MMLMARTGRITTAAMKGAPVFNSLLEPLLGSFVGEELAEVTLVVGRNSVSSSLSPTRSSG